MGIQKRHSAPGVMCNYIESQDQLHAIETYRLLLVLHMYGLTWISTEVKNMIFFMVAIEGRDEVLYTYTCSLVVAPLLAFLGTFNSNHSKLESNEYPPFV